MHWYCYLLSFLGVLYESLVLAQRQCSFPQLPDHAKPWTSVDIRVLYNHNEQFKYTCEEKYHFQSAPSLMTTKIWCSDGQWRPARFWRCVDECGGCVHGNCIRTMDPRTRTPISKCVCDKNYAGDDCSASVCELYPLKSHHAAPSAPAAHGGGYVPVELSVRFSCKAGYGFRVEGTGGWDTVMQSTCTTTGWDPLVRDCEEIVCSPPEGNYLIVRERLQSIARKSNNPVFYRVGDVVTVSCSEGCLSDRRALTCSARGEWSPGTPRCIIPACKTVPHVENARRSPYSRGPPFPVGTEIRYQCISGYYMIGRPRIKCQRPSMTCSPGEEPRWEHHPQCQSKNCSPNHREEKTSDGIIRCVLITQPIIRTTVNSTVKPLTIVTATAGALLLLLLIVISLVAYQRRRIALAHRRQARAQASEAEANNDRFSFVYYTNDIHVVLPSYDEAVGTGAPPPYASDSASGSTENVNTSVAQEVTVDSEPENEPLYEVIDETIHITSSTSGATGATGATGDGVPTSNVLHKELGSTADEDVDSVISLSMDDPSCDDTTPLVD